ncbi:hypothetical protein D9M73_217980 [compost metagenome]
MNSAFVVFVVALVVMLVAVIWRDWKYPFLQLSPAWNKSIAHKIAVVAYAIAMIGLVTFLWMFFKDQIQTF